MDNEYTNGPITRLWAVLSGLCFIAAGVFSYNFSQDSKTSDLAHDALLAAREARPFPYTSLMAANDWVEHAQMHKEFINTERRLTELQISNTSKHLQQLITELPRPPESVSVRLTEIENAQHDLEIEVSRLQALLSFEQKILLKYREYKKIPDAEKKVMVTDHNAQ